MGEDGRAVAFHVLVEPNARSRLGQDRCERGLADLQRVTTPEEVPALIDVESLLAPQCPWAHGAGDRRRYNDLARRGLLRSYWLRCGPRPVA